MLPEEDRQALKKNGYQITAKGVVPIAHPLQTYNSKSSSSAAQHRQGERDSINNPRPIQSKPTPNLRGMSADAASKWSAGSSPKPKPTPNLRGMSADAASRWSAGSSLKPKPKPTSTALNTRRYGSADAEERRHAGASLKPKPKPNLRGMSADAASRWSNGASPQPKPSSNLRGMSADAASRWSNGASPQPKPKPNLRGMSADAASRWSAGSSPKPKPSSNLRGMSADAASRWSAGSSPKPQLAIAPLGEQPTKDRPLTPPASELPKPEPEKSWWDKAGDSVTEKASDAWDKTKSVGNYAKDHASDIVHGGLDVAGFIPGAGAAFDGLNGVLYAAQGDRTNAALSFAAAIPIIGDAAAAAKGVSKVANAVKDAQVTKTYLTYTLKDSDEVVRYVGRASGKGTPQEVLAGRISKGHHILQNNPNLKPHLEAVQGNRAANRGAEDVLYSRYQVPKPENINGKTLASGANNRGQQLLNETNPLSNISWKAKTIGSRKIEAYANDLKQPSLQ